MPAAASVTDVAAFSLHIIRGPAHGVNTPVAALVMSLSIFPLGGDIIRGFSFAVSLGLSWRISVHDECFSRLFINFAVVIGPCSFPGIFVKGSAWRIVW